MSERGCKPLAPAEPVCLALKKLVDKEAGEQYFTHEVLMARFQALTSPVLDSELERLREEMGLRDNQKAELLREITALASWVVAQARAGRIIEARGPDGVEVLHHPAVDGRGVLGRIVLSPDEADRLEVLLDSEAPPSEAVQETLRRLSDPERRPPTLRWPDR